MSWLLAAEPKYKVLDQYENVEIRLWVSLRAIFK